jgi:hypothetical protein
MKTREIHTLAMPIGDADSAMVCLCGEVVEYVDVYGERVYRDVLAQAVS